MLQPFPPRQRCRSVRAAWFVFAVLALASLASVGFGGAARAAPGDHKYVSLRGRVVDAAGEPLPDVRLEATGSREAIALSSIEGRFSLTLDLGTMADLRLRPAAFSVRARLAGYRVRVTGGAPALIFEVGLADNNGAPVMRVRSNFGLIAGVLVDALVPPGDRTATLLVRYVGERGADRDSVVALSETRLSDPLTEPWLWIGAPTKSAPRMKPAPPEKARPAETPTPAEKPAPSPARQERAPVIPPRDAERQGKIAAAQAERDSIWRAQRSLSAARKAAADSMRAVREAAEESARRARFGLPAPPPAPVAVKSPKHEKAAKPVPAARAEQRPKKTRAPRPTPVPLENAAPPSIATVAAPLPAATSRPAAPTAGLRPRVYAPTVGNTSEPGGLQRIEPRPGLSSRGGSDEAARADLEAEADNCGCVVRGTVELEFHRLLTSPLRIEVAIRELPALRDTIELFMGSPRAFEMRRVPCGRWSIALRPFSESPFGIVSPDEVAPFDCRDRGRRQVRIVIAPLKAGR